MALPNPRTTFEWIKAGEKMTGTPTATPSLPYGVTNRPLDKLLANEEFLEEKIDLLRTDLNVVNAVSIKWENISNPPVIGGAETLSELNDFVLASIPSVATTSRPLLHIGGIGETNFAFAELPHDAVVVTNSLGGLTTSSIDTTKLGYLSDVTSNIQTQLNNKPDVLSELDDFYGTFPADALTSGKPLIHVYDTGQHKFGFTALIPSRAMQSNSLGGLSVSATTAAELAYVSGVTSSIQTQLNSKVSNSGSGSTVALTASSKQITYDQLSRLDATSSIQTQINNLSLSGKRIFEQTSGTGSFVVPSGVGIIKIYAVGGGAGWYTGTDTTIYINSVLTATLKGGILINAKGIGTILSANMPNWGNENYGKFVLHSLAKNPKILLTHFGYPQFAIGDVRQTSLFSYECGSFFQISGTHNLESGFFDKRSSSKGASGLRTGGQTSPQLPTAGTSAILTFEVSPGDIVSFTLGSGGSGYVVSETNLITSGGFGWIAIEY